MAFERGLGLYKLWQGYDSDAMLWKSLSNRTAASLEETEEIILQNRGVTESDQFFNPIHPSELDEPLTGLSAKTLDAAAALITSAVTKNQEIVIFGDYDADGICAAGIMWEAVHALGGKVRPFLPDRFAHGYGLNNKSLAAVLASGPKPDLLISVDNGIVAHHAMEQLAKSGIQVLLTDHHQPEKTLPLHDVLVHTTKLCGAGIAWIIANRLNHKQALQSLDLAAIATQADQVPLVGANRAIVWHGLKALRATKRPGLKALYNLAGIEQQSITERAVGFGIAPRLNAMGRLGSPLDALRLVCTRDTKRAMLLASTVNDTNVDRQELTTEATRLAETQAEEQCDNPILVVRSTEFHEGIVGLIAGRITEIYGKPTLALAEGDTTAKGSARSTPSVNVVEVLRSCREHLVEVGGHPMAAGCSVELPNIGALHACLLEVMRNDTKVEWEEPFDLVLPTRLISSELIELLRKFGPFGAGNVEPVFLLENPDILSVSAFGKEGNHLKIQLASPTSAEIILWRGVNKETMRKTYWKTNPLYCQVDLSGRSKRLQLFLKHSV